MAAQSSAGLHRRNAAESVKDGPLKNNCLFDFTDFVINGAFILTGESTFASDSGNQQFTFS